jgi:AraC-like DNA-binding protein
MSKSLEGNSRQRDDMLATGTMRVGVAVAIPAILREFGFDPNQVIAETQLLPSLLEDPENIIPFVALGRLAAHCAKCTKCDHFGLLVGQRGNFSSLGRVGFIAQNSPDVGSALTSLATNMHHHNQAAAVTLAVKGMLTSFGYAIFYAVEGADQIADGAMAVACRLMRKLCGDGWSPSTVSFAHRKPTDEAPYKQFFKAQSQFDAEETALLFETRWLNVRLEAAEPELRRLLLQELKQSRALTPSDLPHDVRQVVRTMVGMGNCSMEAVTRFLGVRERTLYRHLLARGTSFKEIVDETRYEIAQQMLRDTEIPLSKIAEQLDYSEVSAFNRAFSRWSGTPPAKWRRSHSRA